MLLHKSATNGRYLARANNNPQYLVGAYEWNALVDSGSSSLAVANADFLINNGQNFVRWFSLGESTGGNTEPVSTPTEYARSGTAGAGDGGNKWDLDTFSVGNLTTPNKDSSNFFERLRGRALYYRSRGIYVMVDLWSSWLWENNVREPGVNYWVRHPYNSNNNINSVNADVNADGHGYELGLTGNAQWARQQAKIRQFVDALKDVDNIIWAPCNECYDGTSQNQWQADVINYIRSYESSSGSMTHPILVGSLQNFNNAPLTSGPSDATSFGGPGQDSDPGIMNGSKPNIYDDDHSTPCASSAGAPWKAFTRGHAGSLILTCNGKNNPDAGEAAGILRQKQVLSYAGRMTLNTAVPTSNTGQCSTGYCLIGSDDVVAYSPSGGSVTINQLQAGTWSVEWMRATDSAVTTQASLTSSGLGDSKTLTNPYGSTETAVYLRRTAGSSGGTSQSHQFTISWNAATDSESGIQGYSLERCQSSTPVVCSNFAERTFTASTGFVDTGLAYGVTYTYRVRARDNAGNWGAYSNVVTKTTPSSPLPTLVLALSFDDGSGPTATDSSTFHNNGALANATWSTSGHTSNAISLNGTTGRVEVADNDSLDVSAGWTGEAWIFPIAFSASAWDLVLDKGGAYTVALENGHPHCDINTGSYLQVFGATGVPLNTWTHVACVYDGANLILYVNGVEQTRSARTGAIGANTSYVFIGGMFGGANWFTGRIDDVRVYSRGITNGEVNTDMNTPVTTVVPGTPTAVSGFTISNPTNGTVDFAWNPPSNSTWATKIEFQSFAAPSYVPMTFTTPSLDVDSKLHAQGSFTAFPADALTDHSMCFNVYFQNVSGVNGPKSVDLGTSLCTQIPVPAIPSVAGVVLVSWSHTGLDTNKQPEAGVLFDVLRAPVLSGTYVTIASGINGRSYVDTSAPSNKACYKIIPKDLAANAGASPVQKCTDGVSQGSAATGSTVYDMTTDFSGTQGPVWFYKKGNLTNMTYNTGGQVWETDELYNTLWSTGGHPGNAVGQSNLRRWICPSTGNWTLTGSTQDLDATSGDGVIFSILKNTSTTLYTRTIANGGGAVSYNVSFSCTVGDTIDAKLDPGAGDGSYDSTGYSMHFVGGAVTFSLSAPFAVSVVGTAPNYTVHWSHTGLDVNGQPTTEAIQYQVERSTTLAGAKTILQAYGATTPPQRFYIDSTAPATAFYWITAKTSSLQSAVSQYGCRGTCPADTVSPSAPYALSITGTAPNLTVQWSHNGLDQNDQVETALNFKLERASTVGGTRTIVCNFVGVATPGIRQCTDSSAPSTAFYWATAGDGVNASAASQPACKGSGCPADTVPPQAAFAITPVYQ